MYLDSANLNEIKEATTYGIIKGVTTNPTILLREEVPMRESVERILQATVGDVFVQVSGNTLEQLYQSAQEIMAVSTERIIVKVPINSAGLQLISKLKAEDRNIPILGTTIFSADQAILAGLAGCAYVAPYINRMENNHINPNEVISKIRAFYDERNLPTKILGASYKNTNQVIDSFLAGAHTVTVPLDIIKKMMDKPLAQDSIEAFEKDAAKLG
ncbi:transaldolase family protein [Oceanobacillus longus]|uniref:Transaldolase family protein n=1 Tax=Oceanobacillus longus TaxID=930120 RepID=A0ABV8H1W6_9BACI